MTVQYAEGLEKKVDLRRVNLDALKPWIADKIARLIQTESSCKVPPDVAIDFCYKQLSIKNILQNGREMQENISTLIQMKPARLYMSELWPLLLSAQCSPMGIPMAMIEAKKREILNREQNKNKISQMAKKLDQKVSQVNEIRKEEGMRKYNVDSKDSKRKRSKSRSRSTSKRKRDESKSKKSRSRSKSRRRSKSRSKSPSVKKKRDKSESKVKSKKKKEKSKKEKEDKKKKSKKKLKKKKEEKKKKKKKKVKVESSSDSSSSDSSSSSESSSSESSSESSEDEKEKKKRKKKLKKKQKKKKAKKQMIEDSEAIELSDESDLSSDSDDVEEVSPVAQPTQSAALDDLERKLRERAISSMKKKGPS